MRMLLVLPLLFAASLGACKNSPTESEAPAFAIGQGVCPNSVTYFFHEIQWTDVSTGFIFGHLGPRHSKASGIQEYGLNLNATMLGSLQASNRGGCTATVHILAQGYVDASAASAARYGAEILVGMIRPGVGKQLIAEIGDTVQVPPPQFGCDAIPSPDACIHDYDHAVSLFPVTRVPKAGDELRVRGHLTAEAKVFGHTQYDESGASYTIYRNGPSMPKLVISLP